MILVLSVCGLVIGLTMMVALARSLADPIESLRRGVGRVERGDLDEPVPVDDGSEIGLLQAGFNQMLAGLREREKLRDLFGRQVGEDVMRDALERGVELTELAKTQPGALVASGTAVAAAGADEAGHWRPAGTVTLRGRAAPTEIALPVRDAEAASGRALAAG